jgi:multiple sugar transport system permease protein
LSSYSAEEIGALKGKTETLTQRAKLDASGRAVETCRFVGLDYYRKVLGMGGSADVATGVTQAPPDSGGAPASTVAPSSKASNEFLGALSFTMLYTFVTLPFVVILGLLIALAVDGTTQRLRSVFISASLLPFIITPVVAALSIKWLFRDNGLVPHLLAYADIQVYWMAQAWSARLLVVVYGIWHTVPFAFIVFYAGLQGVPQDALEAGKGIERQDGGVGSIEQEPGRDGGHGGVASVEEPRHGPFDIPPGAAAPADPESATRSVFGEILDAALDD